MSDPVSDPVKLDRTIPLWGIVLALVALLGNAVATTWFARGVYEQVTQNTARIVTLEKFVEEGQRERRSMIGILGEISDKLPDKRGP